MTAPRPIPDTPTRCEVAVAALAGLAVGTFLAVAHLAGAARRALTRKVEGP